MKSKILPVIEPIVNTYTSYGAMFSILPKSALPWILNNFIQINFVYKWDMVTFDYHRMLMSNCPAIDYYEETAQMISQRGDGIEQAVVNGINRNEYLFMYGDRYYIKAASEYGIEHIPHEIFVYGYDLDKNQVYIADNFQNGKFIFTLCTFDELTDAFNKIDSNISFLHTVRYLKVHENEYCRLSIHQMISGLESYLYSYESFDIMGNPPNGIYGIEVIDYILSQVLNVNGGEIDIRFFHLLYEHKLLMEKRVNYLIEFNYISASDFDTDRYRELKLASLRLRNLVIKYNLIRKKDIQERIYCKLKTIRNNDIEMLSLLMWELKKKGVKK